MCNIIKSVIYCLSQHGWSHFFFGSCLARLNMTSWASLLTMGAQQACHQIFSGIGYWSPSVNNQPCSFHTNIKWAKYFTVILEEVSYTRTCDWYRYRNVSLGLHYMHQKRVTVGLPFFQEHGMTRLPTEQQNKVLNLYRSGCSLLCPIHSFCLSAIKPSCSCPKLTDENIKGS